jgi:hypothetical protein
MARRPSIADAFSGPGDFASIPAPPAVEPMLHAEPAKRAGRGSGRTGKKGIAFWVEPDAAKQLALISVHEDKTIQALMEEALDLLFRSRGKHGLAQTPPG